MDGFPDMGPARDATAHRGSPERAPIRLPLINPADLAGRPVPIREWVVEDWLPIGCVTANYGDGGVGKTLLAHMLMSSTALGMPWCGMSVMRCRSLALFCEDDDAELHRRQASICAGYGADMADLEPMRWISGVGQDNSLVTFDYDGTACTTPLYDAIMEAALDHGAKLIVLDTAADLFSGNENDRHQVRQFIGKLNALALATDGAVLLNAHPSRSGLASGNLDGGSTGWSNSVRSRWSLARPQSEDGEDQDPDARILTKRKANYSRIGDEIPLRWQQGVLVPPQGITTQRRAEGIPDHRVAEEMFLILLDRCAATNVKVSHNTRAGNYAPKAFARRPDRQGFSKKQFEAAMLTLINQGRVRVEDYGRAGDYRQHIVRGSDEADI